MNDSCAFLSISRNGRKKLIVCTMLYIPIYVKLSLGNEVGFVVNRNAGIGFCGGLDPIGSDACAL